MSDATGFAQLLDATLLARAQRGDRAALADIYRQYERAAFRLAYRLLGGRALAEDAVHDAFVRAFEKIGSYRGDAPFGAWLKRLVANVAIDRLRREKHWSDDGMPELSAPATSEGAALDARDLLGRLSPRARSVVWLHTVEGYTHGEIAASFGQTESWSKSILARSLQRLQQWVDRDEQATADTHPPNTDQVSEDRLP